MNNPKLKLLNGQYLEAYDKLKTKIYQRNINHLIIKDLYLKLADELYELQTNNEEIKSDELLNKLASEDVRRTIQERITLFIALISGFMEILFVGLIIYTDSQIALNGLVNVVLLITALNCHYLFNNINSTIVWVIMIVIITIVLIFNLEATVIVIPNYVAIIDLIILIVSGLIYYKLSHQHYSQYQK